MIVAGPHSARREPARRLLELVLAHCHSVSFVYKNCVSLKIFPNFLTDGAHCWPGVDAGIYTTAALINVHALKMNINMCMNAAISHVCLEFRL